MKRTEKAELTATILSAFMAAGMIVVATITHSISILAEGIDTVIDTVASVTVLIGLRLSRRHTRTFPSGLYKLENLVATCIGLLILFSAYELAKEAIERMKSNVSRMDQPWLVILVMSIVVAITLFLAWYKGKVGKEENSPSLRADAKHSWTDLIASMAIIVGVALEWAGVHKMDAVAALVVVVFLVWSGAEVTLDGIRVLLDASIEKDVRDKARAIVEGDPRVRSVLDVQGRNSGSYRFLNVSLLPEDFDLRGAEQIAGDLRGMIREQIDDVDEVLIDFAVEKSGVLLCCVPLEGDRKTVARRLAGARFFELVEIDGNSGEVAPREVVSNPVGADLAGGGARAAVFLARRGIEVLLSREEDLDSNPYYVLDANGVRILSRPDIERLDDAVKLMAELLKSTPSAPPSQERGRTGGENA